MMVKTEEKSCQEAFIQEVLTWILGGKDSLSDGWDKTAEMLKKNS